MNSRSLSTRLYCLALLGAASAALAATDPIEGRWIGVVGSPLERVEVGLEFKRNADGTLSLLLTQPIMNYFAVDAGTPERAGDRVIVDGIIKARPGSPVKIAAKRSQENLSVSMPFSSTWTMAIPAMRTTSNFSDNQVPISQPISAAASSPRREKVFACPADAMPPDGGRPPSGVGAPAGGMGGGVTGGAAP